MVSENALNVTKHIADKYVVGANLVGDRRRMEPDYKGYVKTMAPLIDDCIRSLNQYMVSPYGSKFTFSR